MVIETGLQAIDERGQPKPFPIPPILALKIVIALRTAGYVPTRSRTQHEAIPVPER